MELAGFGWTGRQKAALLFLSLSPIGAEVIGMKGQSQLCGCCHLHAGPHSWAVRALNHRASFPAQKIDFEIENELGKE